jgi:hypothetical protein
MSGIKNLADIYEKQGKDFVEKLFKDDVTITENLDGSAFSFEKDFIGDNISFYKKDQDNPITRVDRILMTYYEKPITYIESLPESIKEEIPQGWRFGMAYFPNSKPVRIQYDRIPKNHLILTHITIRDEFGENVKSIQDRNELDSWAEKLGVEKAPIIFQGKLNQDQKISILEFISTPMMDLKDKFRTQSFTKYIISLIDPKASKTTLGEDLQGQVDSIVFRFISNEGEEEVLAKVVDPIISELNKDRKVSSSSYFPSDVYSLCLIDIMNFILEENMESFPANGEEPEERYINFVYSVFKRFIEKNGQKYIGTDFNKPQYLRSENFAINKEFIEDPDVLLLIEQDEAYPEILQMILNSFRKLKRKPHGFFTEGLIQEFNRVVEEIASYINAKRKERLEESLGLPSFMWFKKVATNFKVTQENEEEPEEILETVQNEDIPAEEKINESSDKTKGEELDQKEQEKKEDTSEFFSFKDFKKVISTNKEKKKIKIINEEKQKVNLVIGKFQPFNNGHFKMCTRLKKENGNPVFLCVVHPDEKLLKFPFSKDLIKKSIGSLISENGDLFVGYKIIPEGLLELAINSIIEEVNPISVCVGEQDFENTILQREWMRKKYDFSGQDLEIYKTPRWSENEAIRSHINNSDFQKFKSSVPKPIAVLFNEFVRESTE